MDEIFFIILCFFSIFTFAFAMAWILPLIIAHSEQKIGSNGDKQDVVFGCLDILFIFFDCFPLFWLFRAIPETPSAYKAVRDKWRSEASIRWSFKAFLVCVALCTISVACIFYNLTTSVI